MTIGRSWSRARARCRSNHSCCWAKGVWSPVTVEAGFADGDDAGAAEHVEDSGPVLLADFGRLVGMDADGGEDSAVFAGEVEGAVARGGGDADGDDLGDAGGGGAIEDARKVGAKSPVVEVSVGIDEWSGEVARESGDSWFGNEGRARGEVEWVSSREGLAAIPSRQLPFHSWAA